MGVFWIANNVFREARHNKVLHIAGAFAAVLILFSFFMGEVSLYQNVKVVKDVGMATISIFGVFVAVYLGVNTLYKELEQRTIYTIVSKPIDRYQILLGKFLGMIFVLTMVVLLMTAYLFAVLLFVEKTLGTSLIPAIGLILAEIFIVAAVAIFFSSFSSPFLSGFFTVGFFLIGRITYELSQFGQRSKNEFFKFFATYLQKIYDLEAFNLRAKVAHGFPIYREDFFYPLAYAFFFILFLLMLAFLFFRKRDLK
jgi:ABC-type transport system involved in multi-copper enzyme maturation permease subunit